MELQMNECNSLTGQKDSVTIMPTDIEGLNSTAGVQTAYRAALSDMIMEKGKEEEYENSNRL